MSQRGVLEYLKRNKGKFLGVSEIRAGLAAEGWGSGALKKVGSDLCKLAVFGFVSVRGVGFWSHKKLFRWKKNGGLR